MINIDKQIIKYSTEQSRVTNIVWYSVAQSCSTVCDPTGCNLPGSSVMGFFRQEHWSGLPFPFPGDLPDPGIEPTSPVVSPAFSGGFFTTEPPRKPCSYKWLDRKEEGVCVCVCVCVCVWDGAGVLMCDWVAQDNQLYLPQTWMTNRSQSFSHGKMVARCSVGGKLRRAPGREDPWPMREEPEQGPGRGVQREPGEVGLSLNRSRK